MTVSESPWGIELAIRARRARCHSAHHNARGNIVKPCRTLGNVVVLCTARNIFPTLSQRASANADIGLLAPFYELRHPVEIVRQIRIAFVEYDRDLCF